MFAAAFPVAARFVTRIIRTLDAVVVTIRHESPLVMFLLPALTASLFFAHCDDVSFTTSVRTSGELNRLTPNCYPKINRVRPRAQLMMVKNIPPPEP